MATNDFWLSRKFGELAKDRHVPPSSQEEILTGTKQLRVLRVCDVSALHGTVPNSAQQTVNHGELWLQMADKHYHILGRVTESAQLCLVDGLNTRLQGALLSKLKPILRLGPIKPHPAGAEHTIPLPPINFYFDITNFSVVGEATSGFKPYSTQSINTLADVKEWLNEQNRHPADVNLQWQAALMSSDTGESQSQSPKRALPPATAPLKRPSNPPSTSSYLAGEEEEPHSFVALKDSPPASSEQDAMIVDEAMDDLDADELKHELSAETKAQTDSSGQGVVDADKTPTGPRVSASMQKDRSASSDRDVLEALRPTASSAIKPSQPSSAAASSPEEARRARNLALFKELPFKHYKDVELVDIDLLFSPPGSPKAAPSRPAPVSAPRTVAKSESKEDIALKDKSPEQPQASSSKPLFRDASSPEEAQDDDAESFSSDDVFAGGKTETLGKRKRVSPPRQSARKATAHKATRPFVRKAPHLVPPPKARPEIVEISSASETESESEEEEDAAAAAAENESNVRRRRAEQFGWLANRLMPDLDPMPFEQSAARIKARLEDLHTRYPELRDK